MVYITVTIHDVMSWHTMVCHAIAYNIMVCHGMPCNSMVYFHMGGL